MFPGPTPELIHLSDTGQGKGRLQSPRGTALNQMAPKGQDLKEKGVAFPEPLSVQLAPESRASSKVAGHRAGYRELSGC